MNEYENNNLNASEALTGVSEVNTLDNSTETASQTPSEGSESDFQTAQTDNSLVNVSETAPEASKKKSDTRSKSEKLNDRADALAAQLKKLRKEARAAEKAEKQAAEKAKHDAFVSKAVRIWTMVSDEAFGLGVGEQGGSMKEYLELNLERYDKFKKSQEEGV